MFLRSTCSYFGLLVVTLTAASACAADSTARGLALHAVEAGFAGYHRAGEWTPLIVDLGSTDVGPTVLQVETRTLDAEGSEAIRTTTFTELQWSEGHVRLETTFQAGRAGSDLVVAVRDEQNELILEQRLRAGSEAYPLEVSRSEALWIYAAAYASPSGTGVRRRELPQPEGTRVVPLSRDRLPSSGQGFAAADAVWLRGDADLPAATAAALRHYVAAGGHLIIPVGRYGDVLKTHAVAKWLPFEIKGQFRAGVQDLTTLSTFAQADRRLPAAARISGASLARPLALTLAGSASQPLIGSSPYGFGRVTFVAIDLDEVPIVTWPGLPRLLVNIARKRTDGGGRVARRITRPGVSELATQLFRAESQFENVRRAGSGSVLLILFVYAILIGPVDYLIVHRLLKRPALTWITLPTLVLGAALTMNAFATEAGAKTRINRLQLLDYDGSSQFSRVRTDLAVYARDAQRFDIEFPATLTETNHSRGESSSPAPLRWFAPPETTFGGLDREAAGSLFRPAYEVSPNREGTSPVAVRDVPLLAHGARSFVGEELAVATQIFEADLNSSTRGVLSGRVINRHTSPIVNYVIAFEDRVYKPIDDQDVWQPGEALTFDRRRFEVLELKSLLTRPVVKKVQRGEGSTSIDVIRTQTAYDPANDDLNFILRTLTFHEAAGGENYTGLANTVRQRDDFSSLLMLGRAVIVGQLQSPELHARALGRGGREFQPTASWGFVRAVLPVAGTATAERSGNSAARAE